MKDLKAMPLDALISSLELEEDQETVAKLADELGDRGDSLALVPLISKYDHDSPIATRIAIIKAIGCFNEAAPTEFLDEILKETDISDELIKQVFFAFCNDSDGVAYVEAVALESENPEWMQIAVEVMDEVTS